MPSVSTENATSGPVRRRDHATIRFLLRLLLLGLSGFFPCWALECEDSPPELCAAVRDAAAQIPWNLEARGKLLEVLSSTEKVDQFVCTFFTETDKHDGVATSKPFTGPVIETARIYLELFSEVGEFDFLDLHGDGRVQLLSTNHWPTKADFFVVEEMGGTFALFRIDNETGIGGLSSVMYRPEGSSQTFLLGQEILEWPEDWAHADPLPVLVHVYEWNGQDWVLADTKHKDYYAKVVLPPLEAKLAQGPCPDEDAALQAKCRYSLEKEIAAVKAILAAP